MIINNEYIPWISKDQGYQDWKKIFDIVVENIKNGFKDEFTLYVYEELKSKYKEYFAKWLEESNQNKNIGNLI